MTLTEIHQRLSTNMIFEPCVAWIDLNGCDAGMHYWKRNDRDVLQCFHSDDTPCERAEYNFRGLMEED